MVKYWTQEEESEKLRVRFKNLKAEKNIGQAEFARSNDVPGGPSLLSQHIKNRRPMNLEAARVYAKGFGCSIAEISPRLGKELDNANKVDKSNNTLTWPPKTAPEYLDVKNKVTVQADPIDGYSPEALALAWLLDQVTDRLEKKQAEVEASAVILRYINGIDAKPTHTQDDRLLQSTQCE